MVQLLDGFRYRATGRLLSGHRLGVALAPAPAVEPGTFIGSGNSDISFASSRTAPAVAGSLAGDIAIAFCISEHTPSAPDGTWTQIGEQRQSFRAIIVFAKTLTAPLGATTWTWSGSHNQAAVVLVYRNVQLPTNAQFAGSRNQNQTSVSLTQSIETDQSLWVTAGYRSLGDTTFGWNGAGTARARTGATSHAYSIADTLAEQAGARSSTFTVSAGTANNLAVAVGISLRPIGATSLSGEIADMNGAPITDMNGVAIKEAA